MAEREQIAEKELNLLENPVAFYELAMKVFEAPEDKQAEEKQKFLDWLKDQWRMVYEKISAAPIIDEEKLSLEEARNKPLRTLNISDEITISEWSLYSAHWGGGVVLAKKVTNGSQEINFKLLNKREILGAGYVDRSFDGAKTQSKEIYVIYASNSVSLLDQTERKI